MKHYKRTRQHLAAALTYMAQRLAREFHSQYYQEGLKNLKPLELEARLAMLFLFDYILNAKQVPDNLREGFLSDGFRNLSRQPYTKQVVEKEAVTFFEQRFNEYADLAVNKGSQWFSWFVDDLYQNLKGSALHQAAQRSYNLPVTHKLESWAKSLEAQYFFTDQFLEAILQQRPALKAYQQVKQLNGEPPLSGLAFWRAWLFRV